MPNPYDIHPNLEELAYRIQAWQKATFNHTSILGNQRHLAKEVQEFIQRLEAGEADISQVMQEEEGYEELADQFFMLIQDANIPLLIEALAHKLEKNKLREWPSTSDADGVYEHIRGKHD